MWGKLLGAAIGFLLIGNPLGILIGIFVGHLFDRGYGRRLRFNSWLNVNSAQQRYLRQIFFRVTFQVMGHVAKADGRVSEDEIRVARGIMHRMRLNDTQKREAIAFFNEGKQPDFNLTQALNELANACAQQHLLLKMFVEVQYQAALAGGSIAPQQQGILTIISRRLGFAPFFSQFQSGWSQSGSTGGAGQRAYRNTSATSLQESYALLGIDNDASSRDIKRAYRKQMSQHHPDKLIAQGLPEEMIKLATDKAQKIQAAYEQIRSTRGF